MKKLFTRLCTFVLCLSVLFSSMLCACTKEQEKSGGNVKLWSAPSYVKIYQDIDYSQSEEYLEFYNSTELSLSMFINEKEGVHLILTPDYDVNEYIVSISDLISSNGKKITKDKISIYNQKYVDVTVPSASHTNSVLGMVPDAILPFEKAVQYEENKIAANNNQGIYFEIDSKGVVAGTYSGSVTITVDQNTYNMGTKVEVWSAEVSEENHLKSSFLLRTKELLDNEKDSTDEMYTTYYEQFLDYRLNITKFTQSFDEETYINGLRKYYPNSAIPTIHFPRCEDSSRTNYDFELVRYWYKKIAELCFEDGVNYFDKMYYYLAIIDEPSLTKTEDKVVPIYKNFAIARHSVIDELTTNKASYNVSEELFDSVVYEIENFELLLTSSYRADFVYENNMSSPENPEERYVITWCPYMSSYNTNSDADKHRNEGLDEWWYGCNYPVNPYPTYHLDDEILTARIFSWMAYEYDVVGNLYWRVNFTGEQNSFGVSEAVEDPYDITNLSQKTNGEGVLVYPGMPYGINGFVPSIRLVAIRDGMEDYEILRLAGEKCKSIAKEAGYLDFDINTTFSKLYQALYDGTKVVGDVESFTAARELLSNFVVFAENGTVITDVQNTAFSTLVKIYVSNGTLKVGGTEASFVQKGNGKEYTVEVKQNKTENYLNFTLDTGTETIEFKMSVGGKKEALELSKINFSTNNKVNDITSTTNQDGSVTVNMDGLKWKDENTKTPWDDASQRIYLSGDELSKNLKKSKGITAISFMIENPGDEVELRIRFTGARKPDDVLDFITERIEANSTTLITVGTGALSWDFGAIEQFRLHFTYGDVYKQNTIVIKSIIITL